MNLHIVLNTFSNDARVEKETETLANLPFVENVEIVALWEAGLPQTEVIGARRHVSRIRLRSRRLPKDLLSQTIKYGEFIWRVVRSPAFRNVEVTHCHDLNTLPIGVLLKTLRGSRVVYDAHELETERHGMTGYRRVLARILERYLVRRVDAIIVVSDSIAEWYERAYRIQRPLVLRNIPRRKNVPGRDHSLLRKRLGLGDDARVFLYQGLISEARGIRRLLDVFSGLPSAHLVCLGFGPLVASVQKHSRRYPNIHYLPAVPNSELLSYTIGADVGVCLGDSPNLSYQFSLPNKLFEYVLAGLPVVIFDHPDKRRFVESWDCGWVVPHETVGIREALAAIGQEDLAARRTAALRAARNLDWNLEAVPLIALYRKLAEQCL
jgi:glycosyltransferase involved in cell wall biosynthesis